MGGTISFNKEIKILYTLKQQVAIVMSLNILEMVIVTMKTTMRPAILMTVTVVDQMLIHNIARNAYVLKI